MKISDTASQAVEGYFKIETFKNDKIVDTFEGHNMIMNLARNNMAELVAGLAEGEPINKFVIGTLGSKTTDVLVPKDSTDGFTPTVTSLFSENTTNYSYAIQFQPTGINAVQVPVYETDTGSTVKITVTGTATTFEIVVSENAANNLGTGAAAVGYTEAALYCGSQIFAMRCFPVKAKDVDTRLKITWTIQF